ncbi:hypothetical protein JOD54_005310 [Actinokineospora baliensis]|uniref:Rv0361 family membrane protein n=1 Tax=Actinokineospora baliensis TaxID=547056 RepID=UPI00195EC5D1|nr:DUF4878 domain-containing protein [Actinokineospora baliensis]MBM7775106.1 hypothetical protein [Actinokineospora baliensis]
MTQPPHDPYAGQPQPGGQQPDQGGYPQAFPQQTQFLPSGSFPTQDPSAQQYPPQQQPQQPVQPEYGQYPGAQPGAHPAQPVPPQPGFPQSGHYPPGQYPGGEQFAPGGYAPQPGQFPQAGGYPGVPGQQPTGYPHGNPYGPPRRNNLPLLLAGGGLLVIGIVVTLILVLSGGGTGSPRGAAEEFIDAVVGRDAAAFNKVMCDEDDHTTQEKIDKDKDFTVTDTEITNVTENGDMALVEFTATVSGRKTTVQLRLSKKADQWCVQRISGA